MYTVVSPLRFPGQECAISSFSEYILCAKINFQLTQVTLAEWERSIIVTAWFTVRILLVSPNFL